MSDLDTPADPLQEAIAPVLGRVPSGVFVLTASDGNGRQTGLLASWVQQASFEPPMLTVAVNQKRYLNDWLTQSPHIVLNLVAEKQFDLLKHFGQGFEPDQPAFAGLETSVTENGVPVLSEALGYLEAEITGQIESGDHIVYLATVTGAGGGAAIGDRQPMVHIRKNGFKY